jgi:hypothetical protein
MRETTHQGPKEYVTREALDRLKAALDRFARSKRRSRDLLTCGVCHNLVALEAGNICTDDNGQIAHTDCYVQNIIASSKTPAPPENQA